jgi:hypothetical protein
MVNYLRLNYSTQLTGQDKKKFLINLIIQHDLLEKTKYQRYYVYPGHWFRDDFEEIKSEFHNVQCALCYNTTGLFKKQFNVCFQCHRLLQKEFCRRYLNKYQLSDIIIPHKDILSVLWGILKQIL